MKLNNMANIEIKVLQSSFIKSAQNISDSIAPYCTEIAILGRSNVGKSSIINLLLNNKLAKSSSTPGKTKLINFFETTWAIVEKSKNTDKANNTIKESGENRTIIPLVIIDFPGFGYAKVSKNVKQIWDANLTNFIHKRQNIKLFCHLIDSRHTNLKIDSQINEFLENTLDYRPGNDCKILNIYTKDDKLTKNDLHKLRMQGKITISTLNKTNEATQNMYKEILKSSLNLS